MINIWKKGRLNSGYFKLKLIQSKMFKFDAYLLKYPKGSMIHGHVDHAPEGYEHHRCNIVLIKAKTGGEFIIDGQEPITSRFVVFRPDIEKHRVTKIEEGFRLVLSIGWLRKEAK